MGTQVVFGVTPGKEGQDVAGVPVYHSVRRGMREHPADVAMLFVPPRFTKGPIFEALDAGITKSAPRPTAFPARSVPDPQSQPFPLGAMVVRQYHGHHFNGRRPCRNHPLLDRQRV